MPDDKGESQIPEALLCQKSNSLTEVQAIENINDDFHVSINLHIFQTVRQKTNIVPMMDNPVEISEDIEDTLNKSNILVEKLWIRRFITM